MSDNRAYDEKELLINLASGSPAAMQQLFVTYYQRLSFYATSIIQDKEEAKDIAQEALTILWQQRTDWSNKAIQQAEAFLFTTVRNKCYNFLKHQQVKINHQQALSAGLPIDDHLLELLRMEEEVLNLIYEEINRLPPKYATLLQLIFVQGLDITAISSKLGITPNNVRNQKARALEKLRTSILRKQLYAESGLIFYVFCRFL